MAFALAGLPHVVEVYARRQPDPSDDAVLLAVLLRPYTVGHLVEAHYTVLRVTSHEVTGRVAYVNPDAPPRGLLARMQPVKSSPEDRAAAFARARAYALDWERLVRLEEEAVQRAAMEAELARRGALDAPVVASLHSGVFEVVPDPFPSPKIERARVLVADADPTTAMRLREEPSLEVVQVEDGWAALEELVHGEYDIALCALVLAGFRGIKLFRMVAQARPEMAARMVLVADGAAIAGAPPSSALGRVLARPVDVDAVLTLVAEWRAARPGA